MSECICVAYGEGIGEDPIGGTFDVKEVIAKKDYRCEECGSIVKKGEKYEAAHGKWPDAGWATYRTCLPCAGIRRDMSPGSAFGMLREDIWECMHMDILGLQEWHEWGDKDEREDNQVSREEIGYRGMGLRALLPDTTHR